MGVGAALGKRECAGWKRGERRDDMMDLYPIGSFASLPSACGNATWSVVATYRESS